MTRPIYYLQGDPKWASKTYKSPDQSHQTISGAGCGITCSAMVIKSLRPKSNVTPVETANWSMKHNYKTSGGTKHEYFVPQFKVYDIPCSWLNTADARYMNSGAKASLFEKVKKALRAGTNWVIASMGPGNWTSAGHYILAYNMDKDYVYINDPASTKSNRVKNTIGLFLNQAKFFWVIPHDGQSNNYTYDDVTSGGESDPYGYTTGEMTGFHIKLIDETNNGQGNSDLAAYVNRINDENASPRPDPINCITIHSANTTGSLTKIASMIKDSQTNYNYVIDNDGVIGLFVDESYAANSTSNTENDARSVNIACINKKTTDKSISKDCLSSLIDLCEDICRRRYITQLVYNKTKPEKGTLTFHSQFNKSSKCPGSFIEKKVLEEVIPEVNNRLNTENRQRVTVTSWQAESETLALRTQSTVSLGAISPYVARISHDATKINYKALQKAGVVGLMFHSGSYFDTDHNVRSHSTDVHFHSIMKEFKASGVKLPFALEFSARSHSVKEAKLECQAFRYLLANYPPKLGAWVCCKFNGVKAAVAQDIIDVYYKYFVDWGFKSKCGIVASKEQAKLIGWPKQSQYMPLWLEASMDENIAPMEEILTPSYFKLDDLTNKGYNASEDQGAVQQALDELKDRFNVRIDPTANSSSSSVGGATEITVTPKVGTRTNIPEPIASGPNSGKYRTTVSFEFATKATKFGSLTLSSSGWPYAAMVSSKLVTDSNGIGYMNINGVKRYGAAFTSSLGNNGALVDLHMSSGETLHFVKLDGKRTNNAAEHSDAWGHYDGMGVTEIFLSQQRKQSYAVLGGTAGSYPVAFTIVGYIKMSDL